MRERLQVTVRAVLLLCVVMTLLTASCVKLPRSGAAPTGAQPLQRVAARADVAACGDKTHVNINAATREELEKLPGVGAALAARIVEHRERYGPFRRAEHLLMVRGISERRFREMRAHISAE